MRAYAEYKKSKSNWLGSIPIEWQTANPKFLFKNISQKQFPNEILLSATQENGVIPRDKLENRVVMPLKDLENFKLVIEGDFVISLRSFEGGIEYSKYRGIVSPAYTVLRPTAAIYKSYFKYVFKDSMYINVLASKVTSIRDGKNISYDSFSSIEVPIPSYNEQEIIAEYLDQKTGQIDALIAKKERQIELLREQRVALINQAVTKGLDPNAPMKDSGVEWIGDIPSHWEVVPIKFMVRREINQIDESKEVDYQITLEIIESNTGKILGIGNFEGSGNRFKKGDVLFNKLRPYLRKVLVAQKDGVAVGELLVLHPDKGTLNKFLFYRMIESTFIDLVNSSTYGAKMPRANWEFIGEIRIAAPPYQEQGEIANYLDSKIIQIDTLISKVERQIELQKEYRTALISAAVTGKIDVRQ